RPGTEPSRRSRARLRGARPPMRRSPLAMDPNAVDLLLTGGRVHTVSGGDAQAVAVREGRIAAVGSANELARLSATRIVELKGRTVLPGFQDAHLHPFAGGMLAIVCNLHETASAADCLVEIERYAAANGCRCAS